MVLAHAHLLVQHVLKQMDQRLAQKSQRDPRPAWLVDFVQKAADSFEPLTGVGRVGFDCEPTEGGWEARLYLGSTEFVGGKVDGEFRTNSFELDLQGLTTLFSRIDTFRWNVAGSENGGSFLTVRGVVGEQSLCVKAYSRSPQNMGPGLRQYHDGRVQPVD